MTTTTTLPAPIAKFVEATNRFDLDAMMEQFLPDALVNDVQREFPGIDAIRAWAAKEMVGDRVTMGVAEIRELHGGYILDCITDGDFDRSKLPDPLILTYYFSVAEGGISQLIIARNKPA